MGAHRGTIEIIVTDKDFFKGQVARESIASLEVTQALYREKVEDLRLRVWGVLYRWIHKYFTFLLRKQKNCPQCQLAILTGSLSGTLALENAHRDNFLTNMVLILM